MENFGLLLKALRTNANLTQTDFAQKLNTTHSTVSKWERGSSTPDIKTLKEIALLLNVSCDELLHPTETLAKMKTNTMEHQTTTYSAKEHMSVQDAAHISPTSKQFILTPEKIIFICVCATLLILSISFGAINIIKYRSQDKPTESSEVAKLYTFVEARNNVDTVYGSAYELVYYLNVELSDVELVKYADAIAESWRIGRYKDSTENILAISFYTQINKISDWDAVYYRAFYIRPPV